MRSMILAGCLALVGCGSSTLDEATTVDTNAQALQAQVTTHTQAAASAAASTCAAQMAAYKTATANAMSTLESICPGLDTCMTGMGHGDQADMMAGVRDMRSELDAHLASGCSAANLAAEMARHQAAMLTHTDHLHTRTQSMMGMSTGGMMMKGNGCR